MNTSENKALNKEIVDSHVAFQEVMRLYMDCDLSDRESIEYFERTAPEITPEVMEIMGFEPLDGKLNIELTEKFRKDGFVVKHRFPIVTDQSGNNWLLKYGVVWNMGEGRRDIGKIDKVHVMIEIDRETRAFEIAQLINYPVPPTRRVQWRGIPACAFEYFQDAVDWSGNYPFVRVENDEIKLANPEAMYTRALYNFVISTGRENFQGIVRRDSGNYFAQDVIAGTNLELDDVVSDEVVNEMAQDFVNSHEKDPPDYPYGQLPGLLTPPVQSALLDFSRRCSEVTRQQCDFPYRKYFDPKSRNEYSEQLYRRFQVVPRLINRIMELYEENGFSSLRENTNSK